MKKIDPIVYANIENLTSLWKTASLPFGSFHEDGSINFSLVQNSDWPNKLWFNNKDIDDPDELKHAIEILSSVSTKLTLVYWNINGSKADHLLEKTEFTKKGELIGMSQKLDQPFNHQNRVDMKPVSGEDEAGLWEELYPKSFGYRISREILLHTRQQINFYMAYYQNEPIGTAIMYTKNGVSGIHGVGVKPEMRRKGFAEEIMKILLNKSIELNSEYATLQASELGKGIYLRLGFEEQFVMESYTLETF